MLTVEQLIKALRRFPKDAIVGIQDHDAGEFELSAKVIDVAAFDPEACLMPGNGSREIPASLWARGVGVVIRCG